MGVNIREKKNTNGSKSLYLDITSGGRRFKEYLGLTITVPKTPTDRQTNKNTKLIAESERAKRELELQAQDYDYTPPTNKNIDFVLYFKNIVDEYPNKDKRIMRYSYEWFVKFLATKNIKLLKPKALTHEMCKEYLLMMQQNLNGETPYNYFTKFKRVVKKAVKDRLIIENPTDEIKTIRSEGLKKDILSIDEIKQLASTPCSNLEIKRAFLFSLYSGLRWCDVKELIFKNIDFSNGLLKLVQAKTEHSTKNSILTMHLNPTLLKLIGESRNLSCKVFKLPSHTGCLKGLDLWVKKAGITKHITWHVSRHSFGTLMLSAGIPIESISKMMGHTNISSTQIYSKVTDDKISEDMDKLMERRKAISSKVAQPIAL